MTDDATMILFDRPKIEQLRAAHASATAEGRLHLVFQGRHWPTAYAMLVLTALDTQKMITHALKTYEGEPCIVARDESQFVREVYLWSITQTPRRPPSKWLIASTLQLRAISPCASRQRTR